MNSFSEDELRSLRGTVVQFNENHKWRGRLGFIEEAEKCGEDYRFMICCTCPNNKTHCDSVYIFSMASKNEFEPLTNGQCVLMPPKEEEDEK